MTFSFLSQTLSIEHGSTITVAAEKSVFSWAQFALMSKLRFVDLPSRDPPGNFSIMLVSKSLLSMVVKTLTTTTLTNLVSSLFEHEELISKMKVTVPTNRVLH